MADYGKGNIDLSKRPVVRNADGSISTVRSKSFNFDGKETLLPTVRPGLARAMTDAETIAYYKKTGEHLGQFKTPEEATAYAQQLHKSQGQQYANKPTDDQIERKRIDDFMQAKLMERRAAKPAQQPAVNPYMQGLQNLIGILTQQSPIYDSLGRKK